MGAVLVTGDRHLESRTLIWREIENMSPTCILVGCCPTGVDRAAREWAAEFGVPCRVHQANWLKRGRMAGPERNQRMVDHGKELGANVLAFPRGGPGTANCIRLAKKAGLHVRMR